MILCEFQDPVSMIHIGRNCALQKLGQKWDGTPIHYKAYSSVQEYSVYSDRRVKTETWAVVTPVGDRLSG